MEPATCCFGRVEPSDSSDSRSANSTTPLNQSGAATNICFSFPPSTADTFNCTRANADGCLAVSLALLPPFQGRDRPMPPMETLLGAIASSPFRRIFHPVFFPLTRHSLYRPLDLRLTKVMYIATQKLVDCFAVPLNAIPRRRRDWPHRVAGASPTPFNLDDDCPRRTATPSQLIVQCLYAFPSRGPQQSVVRGSVALLVLCEVHNRSISRSRSLFHEVLWDRFVET